MKYPVMVFVGICALCAPAFDVAAPSDVAADVARIYQDACESCHGSGVRGAPRPRVKLDWQERLSYGIEELYISAVDGIGVFMPPRGLCSECSDEQLRAVVDFMVRDLK